MEEIMGGNFAQSDWAETDENSPAFIKNKPENFDVDLSEIEEKLAQKAEISGDIVPGALMMMGVDGKLICGPKQSEIEGGGTGTVVAGVTITVKATTDGADTIDVPEAVGDIFTLYHNGQLLLEDTHYIHVDNSIKLIGFTTYVNDLFTFIGYTKGGAGGDYGVATEQNLGLVKSSTGLNKVVVDEDGTMHVAQIDMSTLMTTDNTEIILNGGSAN
ncbi:MAG: hypothetical protein IKW14_06820 [Phascolarctobacterium sp.]|nr:hypothetical protein [Phascolarctobacterium sp.]